MIIPAGEYGPFRMERDEFESLETKSADLQTLDRSIADLLLESPSTAIMHFRDTDDDFPIIRGTMLAVNYHQGHSEGDHLIVLQQPENPEKGQLEINWHPEADKIIRVRHLTSYALRNAFPDAISKPYPFETSPTNPLKIKNYYIALE